MTLWLKELTNDDKIYLTHFLHTKPSEKTSFKMTIPINPFRYGIKTFKCSDGLKLDFSFDPRNNKIALCILINHNFIYS